MTYKIYPENLLYFVIWISISFYESIGLTLQNRWENHYAMVSATCITIGIRPAGDKTDLNSGSVSIGFMLDNWKSEKELLGYK